MIGIAWRMLRRQTGTLVGALAMATVGAALITAFIVVQTSIAQTRAPVERYGAAQVVAAGQPGLFTPELVRSIERTPGVVRAVPELSFPVQVLTADGRPVVQQARVAQFGHAWTSAVLTPFELVDGAAPTARDHVVVDDALARAAGARVGDQVTLEAGGLAYRLRVSGIVRAPDGGFGHQHAVFLTPSRAAQVAHRGHGRVDAVGLLPEPGADHERVAADVDRQIANALGGDVASPAGTPSYRVATGPDRGELEGAMPDHHASAAAMTMLVWIVALMAVAVTGGALVTSVRRRARQFALLRAVGATPAQVRALCQAEALLICTAALVLGGLLGLGLAWALIALFRTLGQVSPMLAVRPGPAPLLIAGAVVLVVGQVAAWWTARSALRLRPGDALTGPGATPGTARSRRADGLRTLLGLGLLGAAGALQAAGMGGVLPTWLSASYGVFASGFVILGVALVGARAILLGAILARRPVAAAAPVGGYLAAANVAFAPRKYAGVAAPLAVGVAIAGWALSGLPLFALNNGKLVAERFDAAYVVRTPIVRDRPTGLAPAARAAVDAVPGVPSTVAVKQTWLHASADPRGAVSAAATTWGTLVSGRGSALLDLGAVEGDLTRVDRGDGIALGARYAARHGITLGQAVSVRVTGATTPTTLPVVALFERDQGGQEAAVVSQQALGDHVAQAWSDNVLVGGAPGGPDDEALRRALSPGSVLVEDHARFLDTYVEERRGAIDNLGTVATALVGMLLVIAAVNALAVSAADRAADLASLRRLNATPRQVCSMVGWEMALTVGPAWLLGVAATAWMALAMAGGDAGAASWAFPTAPLCLMGAVGLLLAVVGALAATRGVQRGLDPRTAVPRQPR